MSSDYANRLLEIKSFFDSSGKESFPSDGMVKSSPAKSGSGFFKAEEQTFGPQIQNANDFVEQEGYPSPFVSKEAADKSAKPGGMTNTQKALALDLGGTALQTIGALQDIKQQESDAMEQMAREYGIAMESVEANSNIRRTYRAASEVRSLINDIKEYEKMKSIGPTQRQFFA